MSAQPYKFDVAADNDHLRSLLITPDGCGTKDKEEALDELINRAYWWGGEDAEKGDTI